MRSLCDDQSVVQPAEVFHAMRCIGLLTFSVHTVITTTQWMPNRVPRILESAWKSLNLKAPVHHLISSHLPFNREGCWGTTDDFATSFLHFSLFPTALWDLANSRPIHSLVLSSHLFLCLSCLLLPFTVLCKTVLARPGERETWSNHCSLRLFMMVRRFPAGSWHGLPRWKHGLCMRCVISCGSTLFPWLEKKRKKKSPCSRPSKSVKTGHSAWKSLRIETVLI